MANRTLERFLDELIEENVFRSRHAIAVECGITDAALSLALKGDTRRLSIEHCLRLARKLKAPPAFVLRKAGRDEAAQLLDDLWPQTRDIFYLTRSEQERAEKWRLITTEQRHHIDAILQICAERARARTAGPNGRVNGGAWRPKRKSSTSIREAARS